MTDSRQDNFLTTLESDTISVLRFVLMVLVVFVHAPRIESGSGISYALTVACSQGMACMAVPLFFIISGFLFGRGFRVNWSWSLYVEKLKKRIFSLFIPYVFWILILAIYLILPCFYGSQHTGWQGVQNWIQLHGGVGGVFWGNPYFPINAPLWFLRDLMVMMVLSPALYWLLKWTGGGILVCFLLSYLLDYSIPLLGFSPEAFLFFSTGLFFSLRGKSLLCSPRWLVVFSAVVFVILLILETHLYVGAEKSSAIFVRKLMEIPGCIWMLAITSEAVRRGVKPSRFLTSASFFLFVAHAPLMSTRLFFQQMERALTFCFVGRFPGGNFIFYLSNVLVVVLLCLAIYGLFIKIFPRFTSFMCGQRVGVKKVCQ